MPCFSVVHRLFFLFFFFNDTATTEIYTLSLHDALPIYSQVLFNCGPSSDCATGNWPDRKSTRLNSSHGYISYAVFCLKKKNNKTTQQLNCTLTNRTGRLHKYPSPH